LYAIHGHSPALGSYVGVSVRHLRNHTFAVRRGRKGPGVHIKGRRTQVHVHGTVSHVNGAAKTFVVSAEGVSMLVKGRMASTLPAVGKVVTVTGTLDDENEGEIEEEDLQEEGEDNGAGFDIEGTILAVNETERTLTISADDDQSSGETVTVKVPTSIDIKMFTVGEEVDLTVTPLSTGGFELVSTSSDEGEQGAEDEEDEEGDQGDDEEESEEEEEPGEDD
jgi:hypothetical protein